MFLIKSNLNITNKIKGLIYKKDKGTRMQNIFINDVFTALICYIGCICVVFITYQREEIF